MEYGEPAPFEPARYDREDFERAERERKDKEDKRRSNEAKDERKRSKAAHKGKSRGEAVALAREKHPRFIEEPVFDGPDLEQGERIVRYLPDDTGAVIDRGPGEQDALVESLVPLRDADRVPIDLGLEDRGGALAPENPLVETVVSKDLEAGAQLPDIGVRVVPDVASPAVEPAVVEDRVFFANSDPDTDLWFAPKPGGFEVLYQLRSPESPESFELDFALPAGAELRRAQTPDGEPSEAIEIAQGAETLATVEPPYAVDAQGTEVPARYELMGNTVSVVLTHRQKDVAYPVALDPAVTESFERWDTNANLDFTGWQYRDPATGAFYSNDPGGYNWWAGRPSGAPYYSGNGLHLYSAGLPRTYYTSGCAGGDLCNYADWRFYAPGTSYVEYAEFFNYRFVTSAGSCVWTGIFSGSLGDWQSEKPVCGPGQGQGSYEFHWQHSVQGRPGSHAQIANVVPANTYITQPFHTYLPAATVRLSDDNPPDITTDAPMPTGWVESNAPIRVRGTDTGLGNRYFDLYSPTAPGWSNRKQYTDPCTYNAGNRHRRCPRDVAWHTSVGDLPDGIQTVRLYVEDIIGRWRTQDWQVKVDRSPPTATLGGSLYAGRNSFVSGESHTLSVNASDAHSGVKSVAYEVRRSSTGQVVRNGSSTNSCHSQNGCARSLAPTFSVNLSGLEDERYDVTVTTRDQLGDDPTYGPNHRNVQSFGFELDRIPPQVTSVSTTPRWQRDDGLLRTTVSATDGRSGIKSFGLAFPGGGSAAPIVRSCGGLTATSSPPRCATSDSATFEYTVDASRFPAEGRVEVRGTAADAAGNQSAPRAGDVGIDRSAPDLSLGGSLYLSKDALLVLDTYQLTFDAQDGSSEAPQEERSGARLVRVEVKKEGEGEPFVEKFRTAEQGCPQGSCGLQGEWTFQTSEYERDKRYTIRVIAADQLGQESTEEFDVYVVRPLGQTLLSDRLGLEDYWDYDSTETGAGSQAHTNLQTGNLVWQATPIVNPGRGLSTVATLTYNSQESQADALRPENLAGDLLGQYNEVGRGFSLGISGVTRLNEPLDLSQLAAGKVTLTDSDGTRHLFESAAGSQSFGEVFTPPPGVQLHLRRWSPGLVDPATGAGMLTEPEKAYAMTRPDGVTYFFDQQGYATSIRDRNANEIEFRYEYRSPTRPLCEATAIEMRPPDKVCVRKVVEVLDPADRSLSITYKPRRIADLTAALLPPGGLPAGQELETIEPVGPLGAQASGPVATITDHKGRVHEFSYDANGYLAAFTEAKGALDPAGGADQRSWVFDYEDDPDTSALIKREPLGSVTDPRGALTTFAYRSDSETAGQEECGTQADEAGESGDGIVHRRRVASLVDRVDQGPATDRPSRAFVYSCADENGEEIHRATVTDARAFEWKHRMDSLGRPRELEDPRATKTLLEWDGDNNPNRIAQAADSGDEAVTEMAFNDNGQLLSSTDPEARTTTLSYETARGIGPLQTPRTELGSEPPRSFDADRGFVTDLTSVERPKGGITAFEYDDFGNVTSTTDPRGFVAETRYDAQGQVTDEFDQERNHTRFPSEQYDSNGLPRQVIDPRGKVWKYAYDAVGNVTSVMDPRHTGAGCGTGGRERYRTEIQYDSYDRVFREFVPKDSGACSFIQRDRRYDRNGNVVEETDGNREARTRTYTAMDRLEEDRSPATPHADGAMASEVSRREYDAEDNLVLQVSPRGVSTPAIAEDFSTRFTIDEIGRTVASSRRSRGTEPADNVDLTTSYAYNRRDNVVGIVDPSHNTSGDPVANALLEAKRRFTYGYDRADNRTIEVEDPAGKAYRTAYEYDLNDNLSKITDPRGTASATEGDFTTTRLYYPDDQLEHVIDGEGRKTTLVRRRDGKVTSIVSPKGTASEEEGDYETKLDYWPTGEVRSRTLPFDPLQYGSHDLKVGYELNDVGDPVTVTDARGKAITNTFLDTGELVSTSRASWWQLQGGKIAERPPGQPGGAGPGASKPQSEGQGDFGGVTRSPMPGIVPAAGAASFAYDDELRLIGATDAESSTVSVRRDPLGRVRAIERPLDAQRNILETYGYDFNGNRASVTDPEGNATISKYDQFDRLMEQTRPGSGQPETTRTSYFPNGTVKDVVTPRGTTYSSDYDALDRLVRSEDPEGNVARRDYDAAGNPVWERSPRGNREPFPADEQRDWFDTTKRYNAANELTEITNGFGHVWRFSYDANGNQTRVEAPGAARGPDSEPVRQVTERRYDGLDRLWRETTGSSVGEDRVRTRVWEYDPNGMLRRMVNPAGVNLFTGLPEFSYSTDAEVSSDPAAAKNATVHEYDDPADPTLVSAKRLPWDERDSEDGVKYRQGFAYSRRGYLENVDPPHTGAPSDAAKTTYTHFATGWIESVTDSHKTIAYDYDRRGDQTRWQSTKTGQSEAKRVMTRDYWPSGLLQSRTGRDTSAGADRLRYSYSYNPNRSLTRMVNERPDDPSKRRETSYAYDAAERQVRVDEASFEVGEDLRRGKDTLLSYDENSNVIERRTDGRFTADSYMGGKTAAFGFDRLDREFSMDVTAVGEADRRTRTQWWESGQQRSQTTVRPVAGQETVEREFFFSDGRLARKDRRRVGAPAGSFAKERSYGYDRNGNRTSDERGSHEFNARDQLVRWQKPNGGAVTTYRLNGSGSILAQTKGGITTSFTYDADGERLLRATTQGVTTTYRYDEGGLGEIVGYDSPGSSGTTFRYDQFGRQTYSENDQGKAATFSYDGLDRRDTKTEAAKTFDLSYVGSSESLSQEQQFGGAETRSYDYDSRMQRLGMARRTLTRPVGSYRAFSTDANGSVEGLEDEQGEVPASDKYAYDPYGQAASTSANPTPEEEQNGPSEAALSEDARANPFRFEGHYYDTNSKTYDMRARPYLPQAGRFLTEDRYESAAGDLSLELDPLTQDRYAFAGGNPVNNIETDGHEPSSSYTNGCDNHYGSDERCAEESAGRQAAAARGQRESGYAYSNNWASGRATSPQVDADKAADVAQRAQPTAPVSPPGPNDVPGGGALPGVTHQTLEPDSGGGPSFGDIVHGGLSGCGVVLPFCDGADAGLHLLEGDEKAAAISGAGFIPFAKEGLKAGDEIAGAASKSADDVAPKAGSVRDVNPGFPGAGRVNNCANCAVATDARLSGRPASALPGDVTRLGKLEDLYGGKFAPVASRESLEASLGAAGSGARGIVYGERSGGVGHVFNAVNQRGAIRFLDGQSGGKASFEGFDRLHFLRTGG